MLFFALRYLIYIYHRVQNVLKGTLHLEGNNNGNCMCEVIARACNMSASQVRRDATDWMVTNRNYLIRDGVKVRTSFVGLGHHCDRMLKPYNERFLV